ncbi:MAG: hypothetical protein ACTHM1_10060 [Solirubrobacteraceae bacterium]
MKPPQAAEWVTYPRFAPYLSAAGDDHALAVALYVWNAQISAATLETLHHVEVLLRNAIDAQFQPQDHASPALQTWLGDADILTAESGQRVAETIERITAEHKTPTRGRVVAGLPFGFWRALFDRRYEQLWVARLHKAFPNGSGERRQVSKLLSRLVPFRNRLAHHETIIGKSIERYHSEMLALAGLIDPDARAWIERVSRVERTLRERPS